MNAADANDDQDRTEAQEALEAGLEAHATRLRWLMQSPQGREVVFSVLALSGLIENSMALAQIGETTLAYAEGKRAIGALWFHVLHTTRDLFRLYAVMVEENHFA